METPLERTRRHVAEAEHIIASQKEHLSELLNRAEKSDREVLLVLEAIETLEEAVRLLNDHSEDEFLTARHQSLVSST